MYCFLTYLNDMEIGQGVIDRIIDFQEQKGFSTEIKMTDANRESARPTEPRMVSES